jgi:hypothetical protein
MANKTAGVNPDYFGEPMTNDTYMIGANLLKTGTLVSFRRPNSNLVREVVYRAIGSASHPCDSSISRNPKICWPLKDYTPCGFAMLETQATALAIVHAELILIHPFRDGNGRCARLLATLMGLQAGLPALDFGGVRGTKKRDYIAAVHAALARDYAPMTAVFRAVIRRTLRSVAKTSSE